MVLELVPVEGQAAMKTARRMRGIHQVQCQPLLLQPDMTSMARVVLQQVRQGMASL